jgi:hypothetical protein
MGFFNNPVTKLITDRYTDDGAGLGSLDFSNIAKDLGVATALYGVINPNNSEGLGNFFGTGGQQQPVGYTGGIPNYTATRELAPNAFASTYTTPTGEVAPRRPGMAGRRYFTDTTFEQSTDEPFMGVTAEQIAAQNQAAIDNQALFESILGSVENQRMAGAATTGTTGAATGAATTGTTGTTGAATTNTLSPAQRLYYDTLMGMSGQGSESEIYEYVSALADVQALMSAASINDVPVKFDEFNRPINFNTVEEYYAATTGATGAASGTTFPEGTDGNGVVSNSVLDGFGEVVNDGTVDPVMSIWNDTLTEDREEDREDDPRNWPSARLKQAVLDGSMDYNTAYGLLGIADAANPFGFTEEEKLALGISESQRTGQGYKYNSATGSTDLYNYDTGAWVGDTAGASTADVVDTITAANAAELDTFGTVAGIKAQEEIDALMAGITAEKWDAGDVAEQFNVPEIDVLEELLRSGFYGFENNAIADAAAGVDIEEENLVVQLLRAGKTNFAEVAEYYQDQFPGITAAQVEASFDSSKYAQGGNVNGYYLGGPTDGMADQIPATIDNSQPAALSDGEFVIPADIVSHLGNGNSEAGADNLYSMMERVRTDRTGNPNQGRQIDPNKYLA